MTADARRTGHWRRIQQTSVERFHVRLESIVVLLGLAAIMAVSSPYFLTIGNILNILLATSTIGILAIGATFVICSGGIDLSLGSVMGLSGVAGASLAVNWSAPASLAIVACLVAGTLAGLVNGILITRALMPPFIVTLGMLGVARGLALVIANGRVFYGLPDSMTYVGQGRPFGIPMPVIIFL